VNAGARQRKTVPSDWSQYEEVHADRRNLSIHLIAVPLFMIAFPATVIFLLTADIASAVASLLVAIGSMACQGIGHATESVPAKPFKGLFDFLRRWFTEQYFTFPKFVLTGRWWHQYQAAANNAS
jgi:hypothetical protein